MPYRALLCIATRGSTECGRAHLLVDLEVAAAHREFAGPFGGTKALKDVPDRTRQQPRFGFVADLADHRVRLARSSLQAQTHAGVSAWLLRLSLGLSLSLCGRLS